MKTRMTLILTILTAFSIVNISDALTLIKESGDNQTRWENASLTEPIVFRVDVTNDYCAESNYDRGCGRYYR